MPYKTIPFSVNEYADLICISKDVEAFNAGFNFPSGGDQDAVRRFEEHMLKVEKAVSLHAPDHRPTWTAKSVLISDFMTLVC
jgi:hypothetical protein